MKQRLTYILPAGTGVEGTDIKVQINALTFANADRAHEEWRVTLGLHELPDELKVILDGCHELHLRWSSPRNLGLLPPLVSRQPSGLHAFFTPRRADVDAPICDLLRNLLGDDGKCKSVNESFARVSITSERFAQSSTFQWHQYSPIRKYGFARTFFGKACASDWADDEWHRACESLTQDLEYASYVDVDFDAISHAVTLTVYWSAEYSPQEQPQRLYRRAGPQGRLEIGVLQAEKAKEPEEMTLGGYLTVVGEDDHPSPTYFSFPSRHHPLPPNTPATFETSFQQPTGLHPKLHMRFPRRHLTPPKESCALHTYMTLPSSLFIDRYQLSDRLFLDSQKLVALHSLVGEDDLEAPDWVVDRWGSAVLLELETPNIANDSADSSHEWISTIPLHLRYLDSSKQSPNTPDHAAIKVPWPIVFWACEAEEGLKMSNNPFDRINLGFDGLFGPKTMFYHVPPASNVSYLVEEVSVPILNADGAAWVQMGTLITVAAGFAWICWQLARTVSVKRDGVLEGKKQQ